MQGLLYVSMWKKVILLVILDEIHLTEHICEYKLYFSLF